MKPWSHYMPPLWISLPDPASPHLLACHWSLFDSLFIPSCSSSFHFTFEPKGQDKVSPLGELQVKAWYILIWDCDRLHICKKFKISLSWFSWLDPMTIYFSVCSNALWETLGPAYTDKHENIWHICSSHCVHVYRLHLTEIAVFILSII